MSVDHLANALNSIKVHEMVGKMECKVAANKLINDVLQIFKKEGYIKGFKKEETRDGDIFVIDLDGRINNCGTIKPRSPVKRGDWAKIEQRFIPSFDVGVLVVSTSKGMMTNKTAQELKIGGRLLAYVY